MKKSSQLADQVANYLAKLLDVRVSPAPWPEAEALPFYLQANYGFYQLELLGQRCLLMCATEADTPASIAVQHGKLSELFQGQVIYAVETTTAANRKRLIQQRVPFIVPGTQVYLPMLGLVLSEHFRSPRHPAPKKLSVAAQLLLIHHLVGAYREPLPAVRLAERFRYSKMTMSRAFNELCASDLADVEQVGREKLLHFTDARPSLWQKALPLLQTPVRKRVAGWQPDAVLAGESALANQSLLVPPRAETRAIAYEAWNEAEPRAVADEYSLEEAEVDAWLELWRYDPALLSQGENVDSFSLYLSLKDDADERMELALEELIERAWRPK